VGREPAGKAGKHAARAAVRRPAAKQALVAKRAPGKSAAIVSANAQSVAKKPIRMPVTAPAKVSSKATKPSVIKSEKVVELSRQTTPVAVPANGKPAKNPAGLSTRDLENFREILLAKRRELIGDMSSMESEALRNNAGSNLSNLPIHMADMGTDNYEQEFTLGLVQKDRDLLKEINAALAKIKGGAYGVCEATGLPISKERLEYQPWVRFSVEHQRKLERHGR